ncbi:Hypothetical protein P9515_12771 [Prochlorococcus marinus str. MIT 9515]|uniref:SGNH hydrolase-type esterase domain-containing protein n=2 Tax=Prochlorococcus marinus TaxID=1219 RepID=A2BXH3_PROM5|nr:Hypothetical protein P9515_12771 [Prochlorococcus marinus str. MIT 9515]
MKIKVLIINFSILVFFLLAPAVALTFYKSVKKTFENPANKIFYLSDHLEKDEVKNILAMLNNPVTYQYKSFTSWEPKQINNDLMKIQGKYNTRKSLNENLNNSNWFFGGSTIFGIGAVDNETIPSNYASITSEEVMNFGREDWASRQSLNQLVNLIGDGLQPKRIIFYDGVNDISHQCSNLTKNEKIPFHNRETIFRDYINKGESDFLSSLKVSSQNFFKRFRTYIISPYKHLIIKLYRSGIVKKNPYKLTEELQCANNPIRANLVAKHLVNNWFVAYQIAKSKNVSFLAILQPNMFTSNSSIFIDPYFERFSYLKPSFDAVYPEIRKEMRNSCNYDLDFCKSLIDGSQWLKGKEEELLDFCHLTGRGNIIISEKLNQVILKNK